MIEMLLDNKDGNMWDISDTVSDIKWKTTRIGKPGSLEFTLIKEGPFQDKAFQCNNGDVIRFRKDDRDIFYGYVFSIDGGKGETVHVLCYDQIRYLLNTRRYILADVTASDVLRRIAQDYNLKLGRVDDTGYRIPSMVENDQKLLDIVCKALTLTLIHTNRNYVLFDDYGALSIRNIEDMLLDFIIGDESLLTDYSVKRSIDQDTYNMVELYQDNKTSGQRERYVVMDSANIARWGTLQLYQSVDENRNAAQISEMLNMLIALKNRETRTLKLEAIGDARVRAGCYVPVVIEAYGINQLFLVDECTHQLDGPHHTMSLELKVI